MPLTDETPPPRLPRPLDAIEVRVLGALLEKQQATPEYYPLTLHALVAACNQKTNREPVTELDEEAVVAALERLREHVLVWKAGGARAEKWEQNVDRRWGLDAATKAVMTLLLLRGEQTPGELRGRSDRLHAFATPGEVEDALRRLSAGPEPLVAERARRPGQKESRWTHLAGGAAPDPGTARHAPPQATHAAPPGDVASRLDALERTVAALARDLAELRKKLGEEP
jgi:uncharacterized protein YceH (UPF0502 family)